MLTEHHSLPRLQHRRRYDGRSGIDASARYNLFFYSGHVIVNQPQKKCDPLFKKVCVFWSVTVNFRCALYFGTNLLLAYPETPPACSCPSSPPSVRSGEWAVGLAGWEERRGDWNVLANVSHFVAILCAARLSHGKLRKRWIQLSLPLAVHGEY